MKYLQGEIDQGSVRAGVMFWLQYMIRDRNTLPVVIQALHGRKDYCSSVNCRRRSKSVTLLSLHSFTTFTEGPAETHVVGYLKHCSAVLPCIEVDGFSSSRGREPSQLICSRTPQVYDTLFCMGCTLLVLRACKCSSVIHHAPISRLRHKSRISKPNTLAKCHRIVVKSIPEILSNDHHTTNPYYRPL